MPNFQNIKATIEITPGVGQGRLWFSIDAGPGDGVKTYAELGKWIGEKATAALDLLHSGPRAQEIAELKARLEKASAPAVEKVPEPVKQPQPVARQQSRYRGGNK